MIIHLIPVKQSLYRVPPNLKRIFNLDVILLHYMPFVEIVRILVRYKRSLYYFMKETLEIEVRLPRVVFYLLWPLVP